MNDQLVNLVKIIRLLTQLHTNLLAEAELKRKAIIEGDIIVMEQILERENKLISDVEKAESCRTKLMSFLKLQMAIDVEPVTITALLKKLGEGELAQELENERNLLKTVLDKLRYRSRQNEELLKASIEHVKGFLKMINDASTVNRTYTPKGQGGKGGLRLLDKTA